MEPDLPVMHPAMIARRQREVDNIPLNLEERKVDPIEEEKEEEAKVQLDEGQIEG